MRIEAITRIDYQSYHRYFLFSFMQGKRSPWQARLLIVLPPVMALAFLVLFLQDPSDGVNLAGMILSLVLCLVLVLILTVMPRRYYKSVEKLLSIPIHYVFEENYFLASPEGAQPAEEAGMQYDRISRAFETAGYFYFFVDVSQPMIIGKNDLIAGTNEELRSLLTEKLGGRFRIVAGANRR